MTKDDDALARIEERSRAAAEMLESSLMKAVSTVESELSRVVRRGEADLERLARAFAETLARLAIDGALGGQRTGAGEVGGSGNQIAAAIARAARRGSRFS